MFELLTIVFFGWLFLKAIGITFALTWGIAKILCGLLIGLALPVLVVCFVFVGGIALLIPVLMVAAAAGIVKVCLT